MGLSKHYDQLKELLDDQICKILKKGDITPQELDSLYKASAIMLDMETEKAMKESGGSEEYEMSHRGGSYNNMGGNSNHYPWFMYHNNDMSHQGNSYRMPMDQMSNTYNHAYDGAYAGAYDASQDNEYSERRRRSARTGRYVSRDSEKERMIGKLEDMMDNVSSEKERRALQQCIDKLEQQ